MDYLITMLATFYIVWSLTQERCPFNLCLRWRRLWTEYDIMGRAQDRGELGYMMKCPKCLAPYVGAIVWAVVLWGSDMMQFISEALAFGGAVMLLIWFMAWLDRDG